MKTQEFNCEIISCENGYIVLEHNSLSRQSAFQMERRKWVIDTPEKLGKLIAELADKPTERTGGA